VPIFEEQKQVERLAKLRHEEEEEVTKLLAERAHIPYADLSAIPVNVDVLGLVPEAEAKRAGLAVIQGTGRKLDIAVRDLNAPAAKKTLERLSANRYTYNLFLVSRTSLEKAWAGYASVARKSARIAGEVSVSDARLTEFRAKVKSIADIGKLLAAVDRQRITEVLEIIIAGALETDSSDIHLEPQADQARLRYRLDGVLNDIAMLPPTAYKFLLSRIKLVSGLKLNIQEKGQDGRFTIHTGEVEIEVRASTLPGPYGENIVLRILNPKSIAVGFGELGMQPWILDALARELKKPNGMIVTTGPTGSGKTTTLYAFLREVHTSDVKIITLEDPIEYHLVGIEQTQINTERGYDFAGGLRSILRQDPDVILVGEMRDLETAHTAMNAALTGHLVFSTLHTNNAAGTIPRLIDLGVDPAIIAPALNVSIAQRLVRRLCPKCRKEAPADAAMVAAIKKELDGLPKSVKRPDLPEKLMLVRPVGCEHCHGTGYKGRIGVFEIILVDDTVEQLVFHKPSEVDMKKAAHAQGQITMRQDGILKVLAGITDLAEVERVVGET